MCQLFRIGLRYGTFTIAFAMAPQCKLNFGLFFLIAPYKAEEKLLLYYDRVHQNINSGSCFS